jgi:hypothetical protein
MMVELSSLRRRFMVIGRRITLNGEHRWVILAAMRLVHFLMRDRHIDRGPVARPDLWKAAIINASSDLNLSGLP